jgi:hypothetical protein
MFGKFIKDDREYSYYIVYRNNSLSDDEYSVKAEEYYKPYEDLILSKEWRVMDYDDYYHLYNYGLLNFMDSYWLGGYEYYGRNGVKWLGYNHDKNKHDVILVEVLDDL